MYKVMKAFVCTECMIPATGTGCTSVDIGVKANLELVDKFCYLGDMLSVVGDALAAVETRIGIGWNKSRHLVPLLTTHTHTHTHTQLFYSSMDFVWDNPGEPVPSVIPYLLRPSTMIHGILRVQSTHHCLPVRIYH